MKTKKNKIVNYCLCILMFIAMIPMNSYATNDSEIILPKISLPNYSPCDNSIVVSKDLTTNKISIIDTSKSISKHSDSTILNSKGYNPSSISPTAIIGDSDDRKKVESTTTYPYSCIAYMEITWPNGSQSMGTAFMIDSNSALTAGHCIYSSENGGWAKSVTLWPGKDGFGLWNNPYGTAEASQLQSSQSWVNDGNIAGDWGVINLSSNIGDQCGWLNIRAYSSADYLLYKIVTLSGYPSDHRYYQYRMTDKIYGCDDQLIAYYIDAIKGQSGAPVFEMDDDGTCCAVGIHTREMNDASYNFGVRITHSLFDIIMSIT